MKIFMIANSGFAIYNFRRLLLKKLKSKNYSVYIVCPKDEYSQKLKDEGFHWLDPHIRANSINLFQEIYTLIRIAYLINLVKPDVCLSFTIKPNIYTGILNRLFDFKFIPNITGLGDTFDSGKIIAFFLKVAYQIAFFKAYHIFFQNTSDYTNFKNNKIIKKQNFTVLPGSGVNISKIRYKPKKFDITENFTFLFVGRLLEKKGIYEFIQASKQLSLSDNEGSLNFNVIGQTVSKNSKGVDNAELKELQCSSTCRFYGFQENPNIFFEEAHCVVLPTYYNEGVPKALIEALAHGCIIITTNRPGCSEVVDQGINGMFCLEKNSIDLHSKMVNILTLTKNELLNMSKASRQKSFYFDEQIIVNKYLEVIFENL